MPRTPKVRHFHERTTVGRTVTAAAGLALLVAASCGADEPLPRPTAAPPPAVETIPAAALPGTAGDAVVLDAGRVATGATEPDELEKLLLDAGFEGGSERTFSKVAGGRRLLLARVLAFETASGAQRYVTWVSDHVEELIGDADRDPALVAPAGGAVYVHEPDPCCHNDSSIFLAVWAEGASAVTLRIAGQAARAGDVTELASRLDAAV
jgi:hypothetical protein